MGEYVPAALRRGVRQVAYLSCEYCLIHEDDVLLPHDRPYNRDETQWHNGKVESRMNLWAT